MALDPSIPLQVKNPSFEQPDFASSLANGLKIKAAQLDILKNQNSFVAGKLANAKDQATYDLAKQEIAASGDPKMAELAARAPQVYDPAFVNSALMSTLETKDRLELLRKQHDDEFEREKFGETQRHNKATESAMGMFGNSVEGRSMNILLGGETDNPAYALAANKLTQPQIKPVTQPDGSIQLVAVTPELPSQFAKPGMVAPNPQAIVGQGGLMPPASTGAKGISDPTPSTPTSQMLPSPNSPVRGFNVQPIAGTQGTPKFTEDQTKTGGFATRMESAAADLDRVFGEGYQPTVATNIGTALNEKTGTSSFLSSQGQQVDQAKRNFINAQLRRESGAVISPEEFSNANKQYFDVPGDEREVKEQKKRNRADAIQAMKTSAGGAYKASGNTSSTIPHADIDAELAKRGVK